MRRSIWKRTLSLVLSLAMLLSLVPAMGMVQEAEAVPVDADGNELQGYITLPITIRDFAADGMLFEYNEVGATGTTTVNSSAVVGYAMWDGPAWDLGTGTYTGFRIYDPGDLDLSTAPVDLSYWYCVIVESSTGTVKHVLPYNDNKSTYDSLMEDGYYSVWVWTSDPDSGVLSAITDANKNNFRIDFNSAYIYVGYSFTVNDWTDDYTGISYFDANTTPFINGYDAEWADCLICDSDGNVVKVLGAGTKKDDGTYVNAMPMNGFALFATANDAFAQGLLRTVTEDNKDEYSATFLTDTYYGNKLLYLGEGHTKTYRLADTKAFGLLRTSAADYINNNANSDGSVVGTFDGGIDGTLVINNGYWGLQTDPTPITSRLNSGATQDVYGAWIATNLVGPELVNGKPIYTQATVEYLANFMEQIMAVPERNADGTYNSYHVEGAKVFDADWNYIDPESPLAMYDLADLIRMTMATYEAETTAKYGDTIGTYADAKAKFEAGNLQYAYQVRTWCEAAYFLLHNTWSDSLADTRNPGTDGYGYPINRYDSLHMVEAVNEDGDICYVFNAKYDGTTYDYNNGEIYNSPFAEGETTVSREYESTGSYVRGNPLPVSRFDPLGPSGSGLNLGYKMSGDTYRTMTGTDVEYYYDETNYHLSLEGHAQFVYNQAENQYFTFTGDDDVYLYINGIRVLDLGGGHSISKVSIDLNKVAELCKMTDGGTYTFDFFYIERHGTAANFGIETNIQLAQPSMNTYKTGYQNGANTGYNGAVDPNTHVGYSFELQNDGDAHIYNLTFRDDDIGVYVGWDGVKLYPDSFTVEQKELYDINHLYLIYWDADGNFTEYLRPGEVTEEVIEQRLHEGLEPGERIGIFGFKYDISKSSNHKTWAADDTFLNTVYTTATDDIDEYTPELHGMSDWLVRKMALPFEPFHVYDWVNKDVSRNPARVCDWRSPEGLLPSTVLDENDPDFGVTVPKAKLIEYLTNNKINVPANAQIVQCTAAGHEQAYNQNPNVTVNDDGSITYKSTKTGMDTVFYKVKWSGNEYNDVVFNYDVYTYGTVNNIYVLDYGLAVELADDTFGFQNNDALTIDNNSRTMTNSILGMVDGEGSSITEKDGIYGNFAWTDETKSLTYTPDDIMDHIDDTYAKVRVMEEGATQFSIYTGVDMIQKITTAPANVVYYEENFPGITYVEEGDNNWQHFETVDDNGNTVAGNVQSADTESNYGSDPNYKEDGTGHWTETDDVGTVETEATENDPNAELIVPEGEEETEVFQVNGQTLHTLEKTASQAMQNFLGVGGADSNGSVNILEVKKTAEVMYFDFVGTGFEILSRTTDEDYAVIMVQVQQKNTSGEYELVTFKPVITESNGGDLYQVPIISITDLAHGEYRVTVTAAQSTNTVTRILYIDGIRIYNPLNGDDPLEYYRPEEAKAEFYEVKQLIDDGHALYYNIDVSDDEKDRLVTGSTYIEDTDGFCLVIETDDKEEYMDCGPNNELYLKGTIYPNVIAFYIKPMQGVAEENRTLQIGAHRKIDDTADSYGAINMVYGSTADNIVDAPNVYEISTGTEMYYTINVDNLTMEDDGSYLVIIGTNGDEETWEEILALTTLKVCGYEITSMEDRIVEAYENDELMELSAVAEPVAAYRAMCPVVEETEETEPEVTESEETESEESGEETIE